MKIIFFMGILLAGAVVAQIHDEGWRYVVAPEAVEKQQGGTVLIRYDLNAVPLETSLNSVIWYKVKAAGEGSNPSVAIWAVGNDWQDGVKKIERVGEVVLHPNVDAPIPFPVSGYVRNHLRERKISFLIEPQGAPGFSQALEFSGQPSLAIVKAQKPRYDLRELLRPVWKGSRIANETLLPTSYDDKPAEANLAFVPSVIISVKNYALDKAYEEGEDFTFDGRTLRLQFRI